MAGTNGFYTGLGNARWAITPFLPAAKPGGRPHTTCLRGVSGAVFQLLRTRCQWRLLPGRFPPWGAVRHHFRPWRREGVWVRLHRAKDAMARLAAGRSPCPSPVIMEGQSEDNGAGRGARL